jgi:serine protease Do
MKKYLIRTTGIAAMALLLSNSVFSQEDKEKTKNKLSDNDQVIIIKKGGKDAKVTVEVKDGEVTVNGKPLDEYKGDDITVHRSRSSWNYNGVTGAYAPSPFRGQSYTFDTDRAYLGVTTEKSDKGARITDISEKTAADKAGLKEGDVITHVGETRVEDHDDLSAAIRKHKPEEKVTITYLRDGKEQKATATLGKHSSFAVTTPGADVFRQLDGMNDHYDFNFDNFNGSRVYSTTGRPRLGIRAQDTEDGKGVKVLSVDENSAAEKAGIKKDDVITDFDGKSVNSADELANAARSAKDKSAMSVKLSRDGRSQTVEVKIPKKLKTTNL